jgi:2OG-Fe(II) oxygenase superfamily
MFLTDYIKVYEGAIPAEFCDELVRRFDIDKNVKVIDIKNEPKENDVRSHSELNISKLESFGDLQAALLKITEVAFAKYQKDVTGIIMPEKLGCEQYRLAKYRPEVDYYSYHVAVNNYPGARRFLGMAWFLNDVTEGGDLFFPHFNLRIKPSKTRLVVFPSLWMYPHADEAPISNEKYVLTTYMHYV